MMRKLLSILTALAVLTALCLYFITSSESKDAKSKAYEKLAQKLEPSDHLFAMRAYPDPYPDFKGMEQAFEQARLQQLNDVSRTNVSENIPWVLEGPNNIGGRINCVTMHPTDEDIIYVGNAAGGVFKTTDGGQSWVPITDDFDYMPIGEIAIDPTNPDIVYVGTGDPNISINPHIGNGLFKSTDAGQTWTHMGLSAQVIISEIIIDPVQPNTIYVGTMGNPFERNNDRGLYKSTDGGQTWTQSLFLSNQAGIIDIVMHPTNPQILYAAGWDRIRTNQESTIIGPSSKIYQTVDGGANWTMLTNGLPTTDVSRIGLDISVIDPNHVIAVIVGDNLELLNIYESFDAGALWSPVPSIVGIENALSNFGWYFGQIRISPYDDDEYSLLGVDMYTTTDGGLNWEMSTPPWWTYEVHADKHDLLYYDQGKTLVSTDGGLYRSVDNMVNWTDEEDIPNTQFYRVAIDPHNPGMYTGGAQDNGTTTGSVNNPNGWTRDFGGDGFQALFDPNDPAIWYAETQRGDLWAYDGFTFNQFDAGIIGSDRRNWDMPFIMSHFDGETMYTGTYRVYRTDLGPFPNWQPISNDLTDGVIFGDGFHTISALGESPIDQQVVYAGTSDGNVWISQDEGSNWTEVTSSLPDRYVTSVEGSYNNPDRFYVTHSGYKYNDFFPHVHRTDDGGNTWTSIAGDLPPVAINDLCVYPDSGDTALFAATDAGVYFTMDAGMSWHLMGNNMLMIPVFDVEVDTAMNMLVAGTFARSLQTFPLDDIGLEIPIDTTSTPVDTSDTIDPIDTVFASTPNLLLQNAQWNVYPNPANQQVTITSNQPISGSINVHDPMGRLVKSIPIPNGKSTQAVLDVSDLAPGMYLLVSEDGKAVQRLVVER